MVSGRNRWACTHGRVVPCSDLRFENFQMDKIALAPWGAPLSLGRRAVRREAMRIYPPVPRPVAFFRAFLGSLLLGLTVLTAAPAPAGDLDPLGPDTPGSVMCHKVIFDLVERPSLRFSGWHFRSREPEGPEHTYIECGQHRATPDGSITWICATEVYTAAGVASGKHFCEAVEKLLDAAAGLSPTRQGTILPGASAASPAVAPARPAPENAPIAP